MWNKYNYNRFLKCQVACIACLSGILLLLHLMLILSIFTQHLWLQSGKLLYLTSQHILLRAVDVIIIFSQHCFHRVFWLPFLLSHVSAPFSASCRHRFCLTPSRVMLHVAKKYPRGHTAVTQSFLSMFLPIHLYYSIFNSKYKSFGA